MREWIEALNHKNKEKRELAVRTLIRCGKTAVASLIEALRAPHPLTRLHAAEALGEIGDTTAVEPLTVALQDKAMAVRYNAAVALGKIGDPRAVKSLIHALKVSGGEVRASVVEALGNIHDARALRPLLMALRDSREYVRRDAARALNSLHLAQSLPETVLADPSLPTDERAELLHILRRMQMQYPELGLRYRLPDPRVFCLQMARSGDETVCANARAVLDWFDLTRASDRPTEKEGAELLRPGQSRMETTVSKELLRASAETGASAPPPNHWKSLIMRWLRL